MSVSQSPRVLCAAHNSGALRWIATSPPIPFRPLVARRSSLLSLTLVSVPAWLPSQSLSVPVPGMSRTHKPKRDDIRLAHANVLRLVASNLQPGSLVEHAVLREKMVQFLSETARYIGSIGELSPELMQLRYAICVVARHCSEQLADTLPKAFGAETRRTFFDMMSMFCEEGAPGASGIGTGPCLRLSRGVLPPRATIAVRHEGRSPDPFSSDAAFSLVMQASTKQTCGEASCSPSRASKIPISRGRWRATSTVRSAEGTATQGLVRARVDLDTARRALVEASVCQSVPRFLSAPRGFVSCPADACDVLEHVAYLGMAAVLKGTVFDNTVRDPKGGVLGWIDRMLSSKQVRRSRRLQGPLAGSGRWPADLEMLAEARSPAIPRVRIAGQHPNAGLLGAFKVVGGRGCAAQPLGVQRRLGARVRRPVLFEGRSHRIGVFQGAWRHVGRGRRRQTRRGVENRWRRQLALQRRASVGQ